MDKLNSAYGRHLDKDVTYINLLVYWGLLYSYSRYPLESAEDFRIWIIGWIISIVMMLMTMFYKKRNI